METDWRLNQRLQERDMRMRRRPSRVAHQLVQRLLTLAYEEHKKNTSILTLDGNVTPLLAEIILTLDEVGYFDENHLIEYYERTIREIPR